MMALTRNNFYKKQPVDAVYRIEYSFDDGYKTDLRVAEILERYKQIGTFYIIVDAVGKEGYMTWEDIQALDKRGHKIGSHTITHPQDLKQLYDQDLHYEIQNSKDMLETVLGHNISRFCYPRGRYDQRVLNMVAEAGYTHARVTGDPGNITVEHPLKHPGTIQIYPRSKYGNVTILAYAQSIIDKVKQEGGYCNIWGHSKEFEAQDLWHILEGIISYTGDVGKVSSL